MKTAKELQMSAIAEALSFLKTVIQSYTVVILHATTVSNSIIEIDSVICFLNVICASWPEVTNMHFFGDVRR